MPQYSPVETFASGLSFALVDGRPVFMDEREDSYFLLEPEQETEFVGLLAPSAPPRPASARLRQTLDLPALPQTFVPAYCPAAEHSLLDDPSVRRTARLAEIIKLWRLVRQVRRSLKERPIRSLLDGLQTGEPSAAEPPPADQLIARAHGFATARRAVPIAPNCLTDSLALLVWLGPERSAATLVFGVKLDPFAAHCWVQAGTMLLNDRVDEIARFQPVRTVACSPATH